MIARSTGSAMALVAAASMLGGCALGAGEPFARLEPSLRATWSTPPDRVAPDGFEKLSSDFQIQISRAELELERLELRSSASASTAGFNPASPPPGYSLCHGGHCHRDDGALVGYEEIEAELRGGGAGATTVLVIPLEAADLLAGETRALSCPEECELPLGGASSMELRARRLSVEGRVRDGRSTPRLAEQGFRLQLVLPDDAPAFTAAVSIPADRESPPSVRLEIALLLTARIFDGVDWPAVAAASPGPELELPQSGDEAAAAALIDTLADSDLQATITRTDF